MKKFMSVILCILIAVCSAMPCFAASSSEGELRFAVASDLHYVHPVSTVDTQIDSEGKVSFNSQSGKYTAPSGFVIDSFLDACAENDECDFILIPGDLATYGRDFPQEHENVAEKFRAFEQKTGKQIYVINGNHDNGSGSVTDHNRFVSVYHEFGYDEAFSVDEGTCSYAVDLNEKYTLIALDSCDESYSLHSDLNSSRMKWVRAQAKHAKETGRKPILMMHHNLLEHNPFQRITMEGFIVSTPYITAARFASMGIELCITGHSHLNDVKSFTDAFGRTVYDFSMSALSEFPAEYKLFTVDDSGITYKTASVGGIDSEALSRVCSGFSEAQLAAMAEDYHAFVNEQNEEKIGREIKNILSAEGLGIKESIPFYPLISSALNSVTDYLDLPLYGENSLSSVAEGYGLAIPKSEFTTLRGMICDAYEGTVTGRKLYTKGSAQYEVMTKAVAVVLRSSLAFAADSELLGGANALLEKAGVQDGIADSVMKRNCERFGFATPTEKLAFSLVYSLFGGYIGEDDGTDNRDGFLSTEKESVMNRIIGFFKRIIDWLLNFIIAES